MHRKMMHRPDNNMPSQSTVTAKCVAGLALCLSCCHRSKQGTANNAKALPSMLLPPSLSHTIIFITAVVATMQEDKEQATMPRHNCPCCCRLLPSRIVGHTAAVIAFVCDIKECPMMPRHRCLHSSHLGSCARCLRHCHCCHCTIEQGMADNAEAPSSALLPFIRAATIVAVT
jgi:hypothetical protein